MRKTGRYQRPQYEKYIWVLVSAVTNLTFVPCVFHQDVILKRHLIFETILTVFTLSTSFIYHFCDSMDYKDRGPNSSFSQGVWLGEGVWHRLDNVGSILCFIVLLIHFTNYKNNVYAQINKFVAVWIVILCQEKAPWNLKFTIYPILFQVLILVFKSVVVGKLPTVNPYFLKRALFWQSVGFFFFYLGLDERRDPYRLFHGCWHTFTGIATIYHWQIIVSHREDPTNEKKKIGKIVVKYN